MLQHIITYGDYWLPASILIVLIYAVAATVLIRAKKDDAPTNDEREAEDYDSDSLQRRAW